MTEQDLIAQRLLRQHLCTPAPEKQVLQDLCGLQAQFLSNALHALRIRSVEEASDNDDLVKTWTLRGTMHLFHQEDLPLMLHQGRSHFLRPKDTLAEDDLVSAERKAHFADLVLDAVAQGLDSREDLKELCAEHGMTDPEAESLFDPWGGLIRAMCETGTLCHQIQEKKAYRLCPLFQPLGREEAELELARRYFTHYGPASIKDAAYFFGATQKQVKTWLEQLPVEKTACGGVDYYNIGKLSSSPAIPDCIFLAGFDPMLLGYEKTQNPILPQEHLRRVYNLAGIVMPTILLRGRIVGKWKRSGKKLLLTLFEPVEDLPPVYQAAERLWPGVVTQINTGKERNA